MIVSPLYEIAIRTYILFLRGIAPFNAKVKRWLVDRKDKEIDFSLYENAVWFHCASAGEFQQALPLIREIKKENINQVVVVSFFSVSGFDQVERHELIDEFFYINFDTRNRSKEFLDYFNPKLVIFVKYEFWYNLLNELNKKNIPIVFISSTFKQNHLAFSRYLSWFRSVLLPIKKFYLQDEKSKKLLGEIGIDNVLVVGDTRVDRVMNIKNQIGDSGNFKQIESQKIIVLGSVHLSDLAYIDFKYLKKQNYRIVIAPHELTQTDAILRSIDMKLELYSTQVDKLRTDTIVDQYGVLASLYSSATIVYIGGGFGEGIHNTLEPAIWEKPMIFGPKYTKFPEAVYFVSHDCAVSIRSIEAFGNAISYFEKADNYDQAEERIKVYFKRNIGASQNIFNDLVAMKLV